jgi:hypothetical protein
VSDIVLFCGISSGLPDTMVWCNTLGFFSGREYVNNEVRLRCILSLRWKAFEDRNPNPEDSIWSWGFIVSSQVLRLEGTSLGWSCDIGNFRGATAWWPWSDTVWAGNILYPHRPLVVTGKQGVGKCLWVIPSGPLDTMVECNTLSFFFGFF